jgi:hypothetical protein
MSDNPSSQDGKLPKRVRGFVREQLLTGEEILWIGQPNRLRYMKTSRLETTLGILSLIVTIPLAWWLGRLTNSTSESKIYVPIVSAVFIAGSAWLCLAPARAWYVAHTIFYMITNKRVLVATSPIYKRQRLESDWPNSLNHIKRLNSSSECADVLFRQRAITNDEGVRVVEETGFLGVNDPDEVESKLRNLTETHAGA